MVGRHPTGMGPVWLAPNWEGPSKTVTQLGGSHHGGHPTGRVPVRLSPDRGAATHPVAALSPLPVASSRARLPPGPGRSLWRFGGPSGDVEGTPP